MQAVRCVWGDKRDIGCVGVCEGINEMEAV